MMKSDDEDTMDESLREAIRIPGILKTPPTDTETEDERVEVNKDKTESTTVQSKSHKTEKLEASGRRHTSSSFGCVTTKATTKSTTKQRTKTTRYNKSNQSDKFINTRRRLSLKLPKLDHVFFGSKETDESEPESVQHKQVSPPQSPLSKQLQDASDTDLSLTYSMTRRPLRNVKEAKWTKTKVDYYDIAAKIILLGDYSVGKTRFLRTLSRAKDEEGCGCCKEYRQNELVEIMFKRDKKTAIIRVMDTGGQERYRSMTSSYYRGVHGCILMFDVNKEETFENVMTWYTDLNKYSHEQYVATILVGTTSFSLERQVPPERGFKLAESLGVPYIECSPDDETMALVTVQRLTEKVIRFALKRTSFSIEIKPPPESKVETLKQQFTCLC